MMRILNPTFRVMTLAGLLALGCGCVFQDLGDLPAFQASDMPNTNNGVDMGGDTDPDLLDMAPDSQDMPPEDMPEDTPPDLPEDMTPDIPEDMPPDMPGIPSGTVCFTQSPPTPACNPVEQTGCMVGLECKMVFLNGALSAQCTNTNSGNLQVGQTCNPASLTPECEPELNCVVNVCRQICRIYDAYGCDPEGPNPACRNEYSESGFGTCQPAC